MKTHPIYVSYHLFNYFLQFFVKATLLEQMQQCYDMAQVEFNKSMETLKSKESVR